MYKHSAVCGYAMATRLSVHHVLVLYTTFFANYGWGKRKNKSNQTKEVITRKTISFINIHLHITITVCIVPKTAEQIDTIFVTEAHTNINTHL